MRLLSKDVCRAHCISVQDGESHPTFGSIICWPISGQNKVESLPSATYFHKHLSFCPQGGCVYLSMHWDRHPLGRQGGVSQHALGQTPPWADTPVDRHPTGQTPPWADSPPGQTSPWTDTPIGRQTSWTDIPLDRHPHGQTSPWADTPSQTPPWVGTSPPMATAADGIILLECFLVFILYMTLLSNLCKMWCPLNLVLENFKYLWFYLTFLGCNLKW